MSYLEPKSLKRSLKIIGALIQACALRGGPICRKLNLWFKQERFLDIIDYEFIYSPENSVDANDILYGRQIQAFLQKQDFLDLGIDQELVAYTKFRASERKCRETNARFRNGVRSNERVEAVMLLAQRKITTILGPVPSISDIDFRFGPGTNTSTKMSRACARAKLSSTVECNANLLPVVGDFLMEFPDWCSSINPDTITAAPGRLEFVPKNCKTFRPIIVGTILEGLYQKGVGSYLKGRLRKAGLDLSDQTANQKFALRGSVDDSIATVDLVSASDCMSYGLVLDLIPMPWFDVFELGRQDVVTYTNGNNITSINLEKFSSMGNGYTFELESMIFYAIAHSVCKFLSLDLSDCRSYGDDIIVPSAGYSLLVETLEHCGFEINKTKTYSSGPFRESCGADYLYGIDIRPFYLKEQLSDRTLFCLHNWLIRHCEIELACLVRSFIHPTLIIFGPDGYGDGHLLGDYTLRTNRKLKRDGYCGGFFDTYTLNPKNYKLPERNDWLFPAYSVYVRSGLESETDANRIRGTIGYTKVSIYTLKTAIFNKPDEFVDIDNIQFGIPLDTNLQRINLQDTY